MEKEPKVEQPNLGEQRLYASMRDNNATNVVIPGTKKSYKIYWICNGAVDKLSRLLIRKSDSDEKDGENDSPLEAIINDSKLASKVSAIYILNGYWKIKFKYWFLWRWFYYVRQYNYDQLMPILEEGKKKLPLSQFLIVTMLLTGAKATAMNMRMEEAERTLQELASEQRQATEKPDSGS